MGRVRVRVRVRVRGRGRVSVRVRVRARVRCSGRWPCTRRASLCGGGSTVRKPSVAVETRATYGWLSRSTLVMYRIG